MMICWITRMNLSIEEEDNNPVDRMESQQKESDDSMIINLAEQSEKKIMQNPILQKMMQKFFRDEFKNIQQQQSEDGSGMSLKQTKISVANSKQIGYQNVGNQIKSPSDTTIYAPTLQKKLTPIENVNNQINQRPERASDWNQVEQISQESSNMGTDVNLISNFVENVRLEQHPGDTVRDRRKSDVAAVELAEAQKRADKAILDAEKFRATVELPGSDSLMFLGNMNSGDFNQNGKVVQSQLMNEANLMEKNQNLTLLDIGKGVGDDDFSISLAILNQA